MERIKIRTLGEFSLEANGILLSDGGTRSRKAWNLLAYLLCNREHSIPQRKLIELLWNNDSNSSNPENALRITLHRLRSMLDQLWAGAGRELILYKDGGYCWNPDFEVDLDYERFEALCLGKIPEEQQLDYYLQALDLYKGIFLPNYSSELWVIPLATHFHNLYLQLSMETGELLAQQQLYDKAISICRQAVNAEPYHEQLHQLFIRLLGSKGDQKGATEVYEALSKRLFDDFGIHPSEETKTIYRETVHAPEGRVLPMDEILLHLQEASGENGAMVCDYDYFKVLCFARSRGMERSGDETHIALLSVVGSDGENLNRRNLNRIMNQFGVVLQGNLRRGDVISRCSASQFIIMLPNANFENSNMVCRRLLAAFQQAHPRVAIKINYMVQPLTLNIRVPL